MSSTVLLAPLLDGTRNFPSIWLQLKSMTLLIVESNNPVVVPANSMSKEVGRSFRPNKLYSWLFVGYGYSNKRVNVSRNRFVGDSNRWQTGLHFYTVNN